MQEQMIKVQAEALHALVVDRLTEVGMAVSEATIVADVLVFADLRGTHSHGVLRVEHYANRIRHGGINLAADLAVQAIKPAVGLIDAAGGMGHIAAKRATKAAIVRAKEHGVGLVGVRNCSHCGALAYYVDMVLQEHLAAMLLVNTDKCVVPFGGREPFFGTNPFAFGFPGRRQSILLDMATSEVAFGKIFYARQRNTPIPGRWAVDQSGTATTDPHAAHALFPFGGVKGYGINLMVEALTGLLVGGAFGPHIVPMYAQLDRLRNVSSLHLVIDPVLFCGATVFSDTQALIDELHAQPTASGTEAVMIPGEIEAQTMQRSLSEGIAVPEAVYRYLVAGA